LAFRFDKETKEIEHEGWITRETCKEGKEIIQSDRTSQTGIILVGAETTGVTRNQQTQCKRKEGSGIQT
jgi:tRNA G18 (ribose-2'-O)-methylase SpoU